MVNAPVTELLVAFAAAVAAHGYRVCRPTPFGKPFEKMFGPDPGGGECAVDKEQRCTLFTLARVTADNFQGEGVGHNDSLAKVPDGFNTGISDARGNMFLSADGQCNRARINARGRMLNLDPPANGIR